MQEMPMLKSVPGGTIEDAKSLIDSLWWHIAVECEKDTWTVKGGEQKLLVTSSEDSANAFIYGMALAYSMVPDDLLDELRRRFSP